MLPRILQKVVDRFESFFTREGMWECWEWQGTRSPNGYGLFDHSGAHRVAWELRHMKPIPPGMVVRHACNNPACVNPAHLAIGTPQDNSDDMVTADRQAKGSSNGRAKLTEDDVVLILRDQTSTNTELARRFGVSQVMISQIKRRKKWRHVQV